MQSEEVPTRPLHELIAETATLLAESHDSGPAHAALLLLRWALPIVRTHETGTRIADIFDPLTGTFTPREVKGCAIAPWERTPGGNVTMAPDDVMALRHEQARLTEDLKLARARLDAFEVLYGIDPTFTTTIAPMLTSAVAEGDISAKDVVDMWLDRGRARAALYDANLKVKFALVMLASTLPGAAEGAPGILADVAKQCIAALGPWRPAEVADIDPRLRHAQAVAETLWHTINQIAAVQSSDYEHSDAGELTSYREKVRTLAARRTMLIAELPADETISDGAWLGVNTIRAELEELADLRVRVGVAQGQIVDFGAQLDQIVELVHTPEPLVEGKDHSWKAPDPVDAVCEFVARRGVFPPDLVLRAAAAARALDEHVTGDSDTPIWTARDVLREIVDHVDAATDTALATRFVDVSFAIGTAGEPRTVFRFDGLPDISLPDNDAYWLVGEFVSKSRMASRVAEAITKTSNYPEPAQVHVLGRDMGKLIGAVMQALGVPASTEGAGDSIGLQSGVPTFSPPHVPGGQFPPAGLGEPTPRNYTLPASTMSYFSGAGGGGAVHIATDAAGEIVQVTCHDVGPEPEVGDEDSLAERCKVAADNLTTLLGFGGENVPEPLWSGVVIASNLLSEAAVALQPRAGDWFWLIDEYCDNEGETFGIAIPSTPEIDAAVEKWCRSFAAITAAEDGRAPDEDPFEQKLGTGDSLTFRANEAAEDLEAIERHSDNDYSSRLRMLKPDGIEILLKAIAALPPGGSLSLYKGTLSTCFADDVGEPDGIADLWKHCDEDMFEDDGLGKDDPTEEAIQQRHAEDMASHDEFLRATAVPEDDQA